MRFNNNTSYKTIPASILFNDIKHLLINLNENLIEMIELTDSKLTVFGIDCILLEHDLSQGLAVTGKIRWFDKSSGFGYIRLASGKSAPFYSCNVEGADSQYPELVTTVDFNDGDNVLCEVSGDNDLFQALGFTNIKKVA